MKAFNLLFQIKIVSAIPLLAAGLLLVKVPATDAATLAAGDATTPVWNEQASATNSNSDWSEQLPGTAYDLYQLSNDATSTYNELSKNVDQLLNPTQPGDISGQIGSGLKVVGGVKELLGLPSRISADIEGLDISSILDSAFESLLAKLLKQDLGEEWKGAAPTSDPITTGDELEQTISQETPGDFDLNPVIRATLTKKQYNRSNTRARISTVLGKAGKTAMTLETQQALKSVLQINQAAQRAAAANVTQDVLKQIALQNTQQALITRSLLPESQMLNQQIAATNNNLVDISSTLDNEQRAKARESNAQANAFLRQAAFQNQLWEKGL